METHCIFHLHTHTAILSNDSFGEMTKETIINDHITNCIWAAMIRIFILGTFIVCVCVCVCAGLTSLISFDLLRTYIFLFGRCFQLVFGPVKLISNNFAPNMIICIMYICDGDTIKMYSFLWSFFVYKSNQSTPRTTDTCLKGKVREYYLQRLYAKHTKRVI